MILMNERRKELHEAIVLLLSLAQIVERDPAKTVSTCPKESTVRESTERA